MKRILQVMSSLHGNGTETAIMNIYRNLDRSKIQFDFLIFDDQNMDFYEEIQSLGGIVYILPNRKRSIWGYLIKNFQFFKRNASKYDAIHMNFCYLSLLWPFLLARLNKIPKRIIHSHSSNYVGSRLNLYLHKLLRRFDIALSNEYIACSQEAREWFYQGTKAYDKCQVIPNGINLEVFTFNSHIREKYRRELGLGKEIVLGQIGYFSPVKNHIFSIELMKSLRNSIPNVKLIFIGKGGDIEDDIRQIVEKSGLKDNIIFLGYRTDIKNILQALDILIHPSLFEGLPLTLVEAQATGLKVLTSDKVSMDSKFTDNIEFLPINQGIDLWEQRIKNIQNEERRINKFQLGDSSFNINNTTTRIVSFY